MSDSVALDLFIQDFVTTHKLLNSHYPWTSLVNRRFLEDSLLKVFQFQSGGATHLAIGQQLALPDGDWLRIELTHAIPAVDEHRFDCLRMMQTPTHMGIDVERVGDKTVIVKMTTRHRGLINVCFVIRDGLPLENPFLA